MEKLGPGDSPEASPGVRLRGSMGAYRLLTRLGAGGMGQVYLARSDRGRTVAVKLVRRELAQQEEFRARFRQEVRAARRVGGHWTAPVLDADTEAAVPWVATGYVAGPSLRQVVGHDHGALPERSVRILAAGLAGALKDIHAAGLVHRDLKPSNVLVTIDGPRVIDFGIARALETVTDGGLTRTGALVGSPGFMAPEQVRGERVTPACDVFCLGSVLAYAATGTLPFGGADSGAHALMYRIAEDEPDLSALPEGIADLVRDCLRKDPAARPDLDRIIRLTGAEDTVADGRFRDPWLPGALVAQLGRHAVRLLDVENPEEEHEAPGAGEWAAAATAGAADPIRKPPAAPAPPPGAPAAGSEMRETPADQPAAGSEMREAPGEQPAAGFAVRGTPADQPAAGSAAPFAPFAPSGSPTTGPDGAATAEGRGPAGSPEPPAGQPAAAPGASAAVPGVPGATPGPSAATPGAPEAAVACDAGPRVPAMPPAAPGVPAAGGTPPPSPEHAPADVSAFAPGSTPPPPGQPGGAGHTPVDHLPTLVAGQTPPPGPAPAHPAHGYPQEHPRPAAPAGPPRPGGGWAGPPGAAAHPWYGGGPGATPPYGPPPPDVTPPYGPGPLPPYAPRRGGRSTAALIAVALVVALAAGGSVYALMRGAGGDDKGSGPGPVPSVTTSATTGPGDSTGAGPEPAASSPDASSPADGVIPAGYLGTWLGNIDNKYGANPRRLTISQGEVGDTVLTLVADGTNLDGDPYHCVFEAALTRSPGADGPLEIGPSSVTVGRDSESCNPGAATEITLLPDGGLERVNHTTGDKLTYTRR